MSQAGAPPGDLMAATPTVSRTEPELREAILEQTARVRKLKVKPEIKEATRELVSRNSKKRSNNYVGETLSGEF